MIILTTYLFPCTAMDMENEYISDFIFRFYKIFLCYTIRG